MRFLKDVEVLSLYESLFRSRFRLFGEKTGSVANSASSFINSTRSLKVTALLVLALISRACRHHCTPEYDGSFALICMSVSVELSSSMNLIDFMTSFQRIRKSERSCIPVLSPTGTLGHSRS